MQNPLKGGLLGAAVARLDGFVNALAGLGSNSKIFQGQFKGNAALPAELIEALYCNAWTARRIVEALPDQALKKGFTVKDDTSGEIVKKFRALTYSDKCPRGTFLEAANQGRAYGGAGLLLGVKSGVASTELPIGDKAELIWTDVVSRHQVKVLQWQRDQNAADFGQPLKVQITGSHPRKGLVLHGSRIIWFQGDASLGQRQLELENFWSESVLQTLFDDLMRHGDAWNSVAYLLNEASIPVMKMRGLFEALASEDKKVLEDRMKLLSQGKSVAQTLFLDADPEYGESLERVTVNFTGIPDLIKEATLMLTGGAKIPVSIFIGQQHGGLNTTGEEDLSQWYDTAGTYQENDLKPKLNRILSLIAGKPVEAEFASLYELDDLEDADLRLKRAQADKANVDAGIMDPLEICLSRDKDGTLGYEIDRKETEKLLKEERAAAKAKPETDPNALKPGAVPSKVPAVTE